MSLELNFKRLFYIGIGIVVVLFLFWQREVLSPFLFAMIFAYVFNPLISLFSNRLKIPRVISILLVYLLLIISAVIVTLLLSKLLTNEIGNISKNFSVFSHTLQKEVNILPNWAQPYVRDSIGDFSDKQFIDTEGFFTIPRFAKVFTGFINIFAFVFSAFFFLKDYRKMIDILLGSLPSDYEKKSRTLLSEINKVLSRYLRGQIILILTMSIMLYISFSLIGVKYALTIAIISALFEIVPIIGPIAAAIFGGFVVLISGGITVLPLNVLEATVLTIGIYYVTRLLQDYLILPVIIGNATRLHPLIVLFSVLVGERVYGILGVILAVPLVATLKLIYEFIVQEFIEVPEKKTPEN